MVAKFVKILTTLLIISVSLFAQRRDWTVVTKYATEVYQGTEYLTDKHMVHYQSLLDRTQVVEIEETPVQTYSLLSEVPLMDKYNYLLRDDKNNFDAQKFNPLKYAFNFYSQEQKIIYYRVDDTDFYILIYPEVK